MSHIGQKTSLKDSDFHGKMSIPTGNRYPCRLHTISTYSAQITFPLVKSKWKNVLKCKFTNKIQSSLFFNKPQNNKISVQQKYSVWVCQFPTYPYVRIFQFKEIKNSSHFIKTKSIQQFFKQNNRMHTLKNLLLHVWEQRQPQSLVGEITWINPQDKNPFCSTTTHKLQPSNTLHKESAEHHLWSIYIAQSMTLPYSQNLKVKLSFEGINQWAF